MSVKKLTRQTAGVVKKRPVKVLQFGEGNFLRAFVDWMIDILNEKTDFNGDVQIIQPINHGMGKMINDQEGLYHVILNGLKDGKVINETRLITCVQGVLNPYENYDGYLKLAENTDLEFIISNTTEAGISFDSTDKDPNILASSFPGKLTSLLFHRYQFFKGDPSKGLTIIPCELIDKNGEVLKESIIQYANHWNLPHEFIQWINESNIFCNTLVDRIVPGFPKETIKEIQQRIGFNDNLVVTAEPFHLWVIEGPDSLRAKLPAEEANLDVLFVKDQSPYRTRKVRILNGAHTALVPIAYLSGLRTVRDSVEDIAVGNFIRKAIFEEIIPTLDLSKDELNKFASDVIERFQNPYIRHELLSIALNSISKFKVRVLPSILEYQKRTGKLPENLMVALASLIKFYKGDWNDQVIPLNDTPEVLSFMKEAWSSQTVEDTVHKILSNRSFWDQDLTEIDQFADATLQNFKVSLSN